ncbi:MAG: TetR family transcriptional regulator [Actinomycetota bacterium]
MAATARSTRHAGIDRHDVVDAALRLVEAGGAEALTMRKLAAELGVTATSVYWHVGSRDEVVLALIERQAEQLAARPVTGDDAAERVVAAAMAVWDSALAHPEVMKLAHASGATSALEMHLEIALARELTAAGIEGDQARDALRALLICVGGFLVLALRPPDAVPDELASTTLWAAVDDSQVAASTRDSLATPIDRETLLRRTLQAVLADYL